MVRLTVVCDDFSGAAGGFRTSYGFALLIELQGRLVLFDAGTDPADLLANLRASGTDPRRLDAVILSHNHYDHTDGLAGVLERNPRIPIYVHRDWDAPNSFKGLSVPVGNRVDLERGRACPELAPGLEVTDSYLSRDYGGIHEQACVVRTGSAEILITGCCHPGLDVFLEEMPGDGPLHIIGGMHGFHFTERQAGAVGRRLRQIVCCHCTARHDVFQAQFGDRCRRLAVGRPLEIP